MSRSTSITFHRSAGTTLLAAALLLAGCSAAAPAASLTQTASPSAATATPMALAATAPALTEPATEAAPAATDPAPAANTLPAPDCSAGLTPAQTEGPYYTADTPEDAALAEGAAGTPIVVTGYVLTADCRPIANAWLDFWQADDAGVYDNQGYTLRGHQLTDAAGRYTLETILPGVYPGRTRHIHVKVRAPNSAAALTTQLYFPEAEALNQADGLYDARLLVTWAETAAGRVAVYNFALDVQ